MASIAELFVAAAAPDAVREEFLGADPAQAQDLCRIWEAAHMSMRELIRAAGRSQAAFAREMAIPLRTVQDWCAGRRSCPVWVRFLLAEHYGLL